MTIIAPRPRYEMKYIYAPAADKLILAATRPDFPLVLLATRNVAPTCLLLLPIG
jgi:hypothetical protein